MFWVYERKPNEKNLMDFKLKNIWHDKNQTGRNEMMIERRKINFCRKMKKRMETTITTKERKKKKKQCN